MLSELEVFGRGGPVAEAEERAPAARGGRAAQP